MNEARDRVYLERIVESIGRAERFVAGAAFSDFAKDEMMLDALGCGLGTPGCSNKTLGIHCPEAASSVRIASSIPHQKKRDHESGLFSSVSAVRT